MLVQVGPKTNTLVQVGPKTNTLVQVGPKINTLVQVGPKINTLILNLEITKTVRCSPFRLLKLMILLQLWNMNFSFKKHNDSKQVGPCNSLVN